MSLLGNTYIFYGDIYFFQNFLIKLTILFLVSYSMKIQTIVSVIKLILIAAIGTMCEILGLLSVFSYEFFIGFVHLFEVPCMVLGVLGKKKTFFLRGIVLGYLYTMLTNGILEVFWNTFGENGHYGIILFFTCVTVVLGSVMLIQTRRRNKDCFEVELIHNESKIRIKAFYDSGNHLKDPYTQKGVHIISTQLFSKLALEKDKKVYIPYQSLGNNNGLIEVYYIELLHIYSQKNVIEQHKIPVGVAKEDLFSNKSYEMILNEEVF